MSIKANFTRVSTILAWYNDLSHIPQDILQAKCELGQRVHVAIEEELSGGFRIDVVQESGYVQCFQNWHEIVQPKVFRLEQRLYDDNFGFTGQLDAILDLDGELVITDYKTSSVPNEKIWLLQAGFYWLLAKRNDLKVSDRVLFLQLFDDAKKMPRVHEYKITGKIERLCYSVLETYRFFNQ